MGTIDDDIYELQTFFEGIESWKDNTAMKTHLRNVIKHINTLEQNTKGKRKTIIHVNQHNIKHNAKHNDNKPVLTVKTYKSNTYAYEVEILGSSKVVYSPSKPLSCGAKVWIETQSEVKKVR